MKHNKHLNLNEKKPIKKENRENEIRKNAALGIRVKQEESKEGWAPVL